MIKLLVSTEETQGKRKNDFCFVPEGEFVHFGFECDGEDVDGNCGCRRSMVGINNHKATTTFKVIESDIIEDELLTMFKKSYIEAWGDLITEEDIQDEIAELKDIASHFSTGSILEKRGDKIQIRA